MKPKLASMRAHARALPQGDSLTRRHALLGLAAWSFWPQVQAAPGGLPNYTHDALTPEWQRLSAQLFGARVPVQGSAVVKLTAPLRAAYGASVPVSVASRIPQRPELYVRRIYLLVDKNPSPVAATIDLTPDLGQADFETRLRVDEYSHVRVVAELSNGELHTDSRYVKTSGGCSAPPNRDSPHLIGQTHIALKPSSAAPALGTAEVRVIHPNDTGFELNQVTVMTIPPHFVRQIRMSYGGRRLFDADLDFSLSENPSLRFHFLHKGPGELRAEVTDSKDQRFTGSLALD